MSTLPDMPTAHRCAGTPTVTIHDNRLLAVRIIRHNRLDDEATDERIERHTFSTTGSPLDCSDARLADSAQPANFRYQCSLSGRALATASQDAGASQILFDIEGASVWNRDALGNSQRFTHDQLHRLSSVSDNGVSSEQLVYGETAVVAGANRRGQLLQHDDPAGRVSTPAYALTNQPLTEQRQFFGDDGKTLESTVYTSRYHYDALGTQQQLTDAVGNRRRQTLNIAGQLAARDLQWAGSDSWLPLLQSIDYDAAGQVRHEVAGNGVVSDYDYEPQTRRLSTLNTTRPGKPLQALSYQYDPVGNLLGCNDGTVSRRFRRNQAVDGNRSYQYDALYQLVQATGREQVGQQTAALPTPRSIDDTDLSAYTRTYDYDRGGNLSAIHHQATQPYTLAMVVSNTSNRTLQQSDGLTPSDVDAGFDAAGQLRALAAGQPLGWDTRGQLQTVTLLQHDDGSSDQENYRYDGHGQRSQKTLTTRTSGTTRSQRVRYLPGLELRDTLQTPDGGSTSTVETLQLLQLDGSGRLSVRALHWTLGQPADIANDGLRYSLADPVGSSLLELDDSAAVISWETYYPYGGTAAWAARSDSEVSYKFVRYSGKERDASGLYAYGLRYYAPWLGRWINPDPGGTIDGLNLFRMVRNNPVSLRDRSGLQGSGYIYVPFLSRDTVDIAIALYTQKYAVNKKPDIVVFSSRNEQLDFYAELKKRRSDFAAAMGKNLFEKYNTSDLSRKSLLNAGVKETEIKSSIMSIGNYLAINNMTLMNQQDDEIFSKISTGDKLKIIGHGSAGSAEISSGGLKSVTLSMNELAERLDFSGLPDLTLQITLLPCQSGDELLEPVFIEGKSPFMRTRPSAAKSLLDEMQARGYRRVTTAGYRGFGQIRGFLESTGNHHTQRKPNYITASDDIVRRRDAKEIFR
ncbi:MAG: hypothetical protein PBU43_08625 [Microvirgula aerodenitrificans]